MFPSTARRAPRLWAFVGVVLGILLGLSSVRAGTLTHEPLWREQLIRILGTTLDRNQKPVGVVSDLVVGFMQRNDHDGLEVVFRSQPGRFSLATQTAAHWAIHRSARAAGLNPDSWTIYLSVFSQGTTVYGESLSAMVGLTVLALARGDYIPADRVITGTVTGDGRIGAVPGINLKLQAAQRRHLRRVLVPEVYDTTDGDWQTPFLLQVSPVGTVALAYQALVGRPLKEGG